MVDRRVFIAGGAGVAVVAAGLAVTGRVDDTLRSLGAEPKPLPDPGDSNLVAQARSEAAALLDVARAKGPESVVTLLEDHVAVLPAYGQGSAATPPATLRAGCIAAARARADDALAAVAPDLAALFASMSASLAQCARVVR